MIISSRLHTLIIHLVNNLIHYVIYNILNIFLLYLNFYFQLFIITLKITDSNEPKYMCDRFARSNKKRINIVLFLFSCILFGIGCWEATIANNANKLNHNNKFYPPFVFVSMKASFNIIYALLNAFFNGVSYFDNNDDEPLFKVPTLGCLFFLFVCNVSVGIFGCVLYFNNLYNETIFQKPIYVEFCLFFIHIAFLGIYPFIIWFINCII